MNIISLFEDILARDSKDFDLYDFVNVITSGNYINFNYDDYISNRIYNHLTDKEYRSCEKIMYYHKYPIVSNNDHSLNNTSNISSWLSNISFMTTIIKNMKLLTHNKNLYLIYMFPEFISIKKIYDGDL
jgi:hypothetical protein